MDHAQRMAMFESVDLYPVVSGPKLSRGRSFEEVLEELLKAGIRIVQLRDKSRNKRELLKTAFRFREITQPHRCLLIIDDHVDIALACGADGVHLGQEDLPIEAARTIAPDLILGASSHSVEEALKAQEEGASYVNIGPIFPTQTKGGLSAFLGTEAIDAIALQLHIPFTVMGGIKLDNLGEVMEKGARHVAVVTAVTEADDITRAARSFRRVMTDLARQL